MTLAIELQGLELWGYHGVLEEERRDGQRFLLLKGVEGAEQAAPPPQIVVITHWFEELRRRVPTN